MVEGEARSWPEDGVQRWHDASSRAKAMIVEHAVPCSSFPASLSPRFSSELLAFLRGGLEEEGQRERERGGPPEARGRGVLRSLIKWTVHVCTSPFTFECMLSKVSSWCDKVISMFVRDARPVPPLSLHTAPPFVDAGHCKVGFFWTGPAPFLISAAVF